MYSFPYIFFFLLFSNLVILGWAEERDASRRNEAATTEGELHNIYAFKN